MKKILVGAALFTSAIAAIGAAQLEGMRPQVSYSEESAAWSTECATPSPGPGWICAGGGWYPPDMTPPGGEPAPPPASTGCATPSPGPGWICAGGGWYPPDMTPPGGEPPAPPAPPAAPTACTTVQPGPGWTCAGGGWYPPGMTPPGGLPPALPASPAAAPECTTIQPGPGWTCEDGGWYPPGVPQPVAEPPPPSSGSGGRLRVMTWNIHFGGGDPWGQAHVIANSGADVVLLQEAQTWDEHMPTTYRDRLRQITGHHWQSVWGGGANCDTGCQSTLILSRLPIVNSGAASHTGSHPTWALVNVGGVHVNLFNVHLEYYNTGLRTTQLLEFMDWTRHVSGPRIAGGDFNSWWGEWWIQQMETEYSDTWRDVTGSIADGYTCCPSAVRFDYLFRSFNDNWRVTPIAIWVQWTHLSDHSAVIADYLVQ